MSSSTSSSRKFTFEKGKLYVARVVLSGFQKLASAERVAEEVTKKLGMTVNARKLGAGEFVVSGIWTSPNREVSLPDQVVAVQESG